MEQSTKLAMVPPLKPAQREAAVVAPQAISNLPGTLNLSLYCGDSFSFTLTLTDADNNPVDLTGAAVLAQVRPAANSPVVSMTFDSAVVGNAITLSIPNEGADSQTLSGKLFWDCQITYANGTVGTPVAGTVTFTGDVSRIGARKAEG